MICLFQPIHIKFHPYFDHDFHHAKSSQRKTENKVQPRDTKGNL